MPVLLQANVAAYIKDVNSPTAYIFMGVVVVLVVLFMVLGSRGKLSAGQGGGARGQASLRKLCKQHGLDPDHYRILKKAVKDQEIANTGALFTNSRFLTTTLRALIQQVEASEHSDGEKEQLKAEIFEIKQRITNQAQSGKQVIHSKAIAINQDVTLYSRSQPPQSTYLVGKSPEALLFELPRDNRGNWLPYKVGEPVKVRFLKEDDKVYTFVSTIRDIREIDGEPRLIIDHSEEVKRIQLRKSPRKEFYRPAYFYRVEVTAEGKGRNQVRKAVVDKNRRYGGSIQDISAGGCALLARTPLPKGSLVMISFDISTGNTINVFGKVRHLRKERAVTLMHVMFTKVSTKHLNEIRAFVFGFAEDEERRRNNVILD